MNETLIYNWNSRVGGSDNVYVVGDFKFSCGGPNAYELMKFLNGNKIILQGNHDKNNGVNTALKYCVIETYKNRILLTHRPDDAEMYMVCGGIDLAFVGHVHKAWKFKGNMVNVGVDVWDYFPIDAKQILKARDKWLKEGGV